MVAVIDITDRKLLEANLERERQLAEQSSLHKSQLIAALSHDARTPLHAVVLAAQLLEIQFEGNVDDEVQSCLHTIRHSVRNVLDLLGDLLDLSKIDAGALPAEASRFALDPVLAECMASIEPQARVKGLDVRLEPGTLAGTQLETDRSEAGNKSSPICSRTPCGTQPTGTFESGASVGRTGSGSRSRTRASASTRGTKKQIFEEFATARQLPPQGRRGDRPRPGDQPAAGPSARR